MLSATVNSGSYGGISMINFGPQPVTGVSLTDNAANPGGNGAVGISFTNADSGGFALDGSVSFSSANAGDMLVASSGGVLTYHGGGLSTAGGGIVLAGSGGVDIHSALSNGGDLKISGGTVNIHQPVSSTGGNVELAGGTLNINANVSANQNVGLVASSVLNLDAGVTANGGPGTPSSLSGISYAGIGFVAGDLFADGAGSYLLAPNADISGLALRNIGLSNGARFEAGNDIDLVLASATSTLSLNTGAYLLANSGAVTFDTIHLDFLNRGTGGILIDGVETSSSTAGGSGLFVGDHDTPAGPSLGLMLKYGAAPPVTDTTTVTSLGTATDNAKTDSTPVGDDEGSLPDSGGTGGTGGSGGGTGGGTNLGGTTGGGEGSFGSDSGGSGDTGGTGGGSTNGNDDSSGTSGKQASDDDKKDDKEKKDKKSDQAKDEKKDDKPAQKKVAQCS